MDGALSPSFEVARTLCVRKARLGRASTSLVAAYLAKELPSES